MIDPDSAEAAKNLITLAGGLMMGQVEKLREEGQKMLAEKKQVWINKSKLYPMRTSVAATMI